MLKLPVSLCDTLGQELLREEPLRGQLEGVENNVNPINIWDSGKNRDSQDPLSEKTLSLMFFCYLCLQLACWFSSLCLSHLLTSLTFRLSILSCRCHVLDVTYICHVMDASHSWCTHSATLRVIASANDQRRTNVQQLPCKMVCLFHCFFSSLVVL